MISLSFTTKDLVLVSTKDLLSDPTSTFYRIVQDSKDRMTRIEQADIHNGTIQIKFLNLDNFFICLAYDDLMVGISDGTNCF